MYDFKIACQPLPAPSAPRALRAVLSVILTASALLSSALSAAEAAPSAELGKGLYVTCTACHGAKGEGNAALNAPAIAGQEPWYVERQLKSFKAGLRGTHEKDTYGMQMRPMSMTLADDAAVANVAAYIATFPAPPKEDVKGWGGSATKGQALYATCAACHGVKGEGNAALNAPKLTGLPSWYLARQLKHFKEGVRGADPKDTYGMQMRPMAMMLADEQAINDVVAFIKGL